MIKNINYILKKLFFFIIIFSIASSSFVYPALSNSKNIEEESVQIAGYNDSFSILPGEEYVLKYSPNSSTFTKETETNDIFSNIKIKHAIAKAPDWLEFSLAYQFQHLHNPIKYASLILNASKYQTDEIAFCIAHSPLGNVPEPHLILDNVKHVYEIDKVISYADIIEKNQYSPNYYSTIEYQVLQDNKSIARILPKEIYYWYIVHPQILREKPSFIYDEFWRDYVLFHNDLSYPLLLEKIENISYLWDGKSYRQHENRIWAESITLHPTAVEAVSYWIGKTVPFGAIGDRPGQPNIIAHQHNGWCGELQLLAVAGLRSVLVPSVSTCNTAEDHVWREFYDNGWHQNDNWWSDTGGTVDIPSVYDQGWNKDMSSIYHWRGDGVVSDVTSRYINSKDTVNVSFKVTDIIGHPVDGIRVTSLVKGLKDITWHKNQVIKVLESLWEKLPQVVKQSFLTTLYDRIVHRIENISDIINSMTISIWNYTNAKGECSFTLGRNDEYVFLIQQPIETLPFPLASWSTLRWLKNPSDTTFVVHLPKIISEKKPVKTNKIDHFGSKSISTSIDLNATGIQYQANIKNNDIGQYSSSCPISLFILTEKEYNKYVKDSTFESDYYCKNNIINDTFQLDEKTYYFVFYNPSQHIIANIDVKIQINKTTHKEYVSIVTPSSSLFAHQYFQVGEIVTITGVSSNQTTLHINNKSVSFPNGAWEYALNTTSWNPGSYTIRAICNTQVVEKQFILVDSIPPTTQILEPKSYTILNQSDQLIVRGISTDNHKIKTIRIGIDNTNTITINQSKTWMTVLDITNISPGIHYLSIKTIDESDNDHINFHPFITNDTTQSIKPTIGSIEYFIQHPNQYNETTVTIFVNISSESRFPLKKAVIEYKSENNAIKSNKLYEYAQHPIQSRHPEDPRNNLSNNPVYGCEIGPYQLNDTIQIRVIATDMASNKNISEWKSIQI
jgi:hypothetical protein